MQDLTSPLNPHKHPALLFNENGEIDGYLFDVIDQQLSHTDPVDEGGKTHQIQVDFQHINNTIILYVIAQREGKVLARGDFDEEGLLNIIKTYISPRIENRDVVAREIYESWFWLQKQQQFIRNVSEGRVKVDRSRVVRGLSPLVEIPNFEQFLQGLINCYLNTVADGQNIQLWSLQQSLQLFLSTKAGQAFNQSKAENSVKAVNIIEQRKSVIEEQLKIAPEKSAVVVKKLNELQELLMKETGEWFTTLKALIEDDINNIIDDLDKSKTDKLKAALNNLLEGKNDKFSDDIDLTNLLQDITNI